MRSPLFLDLASLRSPASLRRAYIIIVFTVPLHYFALYMFIVLKVIDYLLELSRDWNHLCRFPYHVPHLLVRILFLFGDVKTLPRPNTFSNFEY
jgi:hypothetical protein